MNKQKILPIALVVLVIFLISSAVFFLTRPKNNTSNAPTPTPPPRLLEIAENEKPIISIVPTSDGYWLDLKISNIPDYVSQIEYDLTYIAIDEDFEIEKGVGGTIEEISSNSFTRKILLGTESCTNGCKYKYDTGVTGGNLYLTLITDDNQVVDLQYPFSLLSVVDFKKTQQIELEDFIIMAQPSDTGYYLLIKNPTNTYSLFSSGSGRGKLVSTTPESQKEDDSLLTGDYLLE
jgi:hypothetical protein